MTNERGVVVKFLKLGLMVALLVLAGTHAAY